MTNAKLKKTKTREKEIQKKGNVIKNNTKKETKPYEAYLYRWTYLPTGKVYVGIHKGLVSDTYNHSSQCSEFNELFAAEQENFELEILRKGNWGTMQNAEHKILSEADARNNDMYFNKTNGAPSSKDIDTNRLMLLADEIRCMTGVMTPAATVVKNTFIQVRAADDYSHKHDIQTAIDEVGGDTKKLGLQVVLLEEYYQDDEPEYGVDGAAGIGGNHSARGTNDSKHGKKIEVIRVPYEMWEGLDNTEIQFLGMQLNVQEGTIKPKVNQSDDFQKMVEDLYYNKDYDLDGDKIRETLKLFNIGMRTIESAITRAKKSIEYKRLSTANMKIRDWTVGADKNILQEKIENFMKDGKTLCYSITSGSNGAIQTLLRHIYTDYEQGKHEKLIVLVRHPSDGFHLRWRTDSKPIEDCKMLEFFVDKVGLDYEMMDLPHLIQDRQYVTLDI